MTLQRRFAYLLHCVCLSSFSLAACTPPSALPPTAALLVSPTHTHAPASPAPTLLPFTPTTRPTASASPTAKASATARPSASPTATALPPTVTPVAAAEDLWAVEVVGADIADVQAVSDGGFVLVGTTPSQQNLALWVAKLNANGSLAWQYTYKIGTWAAAYAVRETSLGNSYLVAGGMEVRGPAGEADLEAWVLELNLDGSIRWQQAYGSPVSNEYAVQLLTLPEGGWAFSGMTTARDMEAWWPQGWVMRFAEGSAPSVWQGFMRGAGVDYVRHFQAAPDGGFWLAGHNETIHWPDVQVGYFDATGQLMRHYVYERDPADEMLGLAVLPDGSLAYAGATLGRISEKLVGQIVRVGADGALIWHKSYGQGACLALLEVAGTLKALCGNATELKLMQLDAAGTVLAETAFDFGVIKEVGIDETGIEQFFYDWEAKEPLTRAALGPLAAGGYWMWAGNYLLRLDAAGQLHCPLQKSRPANPAVLADLVLAQRNVSSPEYPLTYTITTSLTTMTPQPASALFTYRCLVPPSP